MNRYLPTLALCLVFSVIAMGAAGLQAATITVDTVDDENNGDGDCALREALIAANTDLVVDACPAGSDAEMDVIIVPAGTYNISSVLTITSSVRIEGDDPSTTIIDANNHSRVFRLPTVIAGGVEIDNLTITGGNSGNDTGGGIFNQGSTLTFTNCVITGNAASGSSYGYGGGIYSEQGGMVTFIGCTISDNWAYNDGGGLYAHGYSTALGPIGVMTIRDSTVSGNWSQWSYGGAMVGLYGTIEIINSTVSGNSAPSRGGIVMGFGDLKITNSTISHNSSSYDGRNVHIISSDAELTSSIIANRNSGSNCAKNASATWISNGFNLSDDASCGLTQPSDLASAEDGLLPLADNGGPTQTHGLDAVSAAIDAGQCSVVDADQRGFARPFDITFHPNASDGCDIGSYERPAGVIVSDESIAVTEGEAGQFFSVFLDTQPSSGEVTLSANPDAQCTVDSSTNVFDSMNWDVPWMVTATAVDDIVLEGLHEGVISNSVSASTDPAYSVDTSVADVTVEITDDDIGVVVTESDGSTTVVEDGTTDTYTVKLSTQPTSGSVSIGVATDGRCAVDTDAHVFDSGNWNDVVVITASTSDNAVDDGDRTCVVSHEITASGAPEYPTEMPIRSVEALVSDDDTAGFAVTESDGNTEITEEGATDSYELSLSSQPSSGSVTVAITSDATCSVDISSLVFSQADWSDAVTITVSNETPDNDVDELVRTCSITHEVTASGAVEYPLAMTGDNLEVTLTDADAAEVIITESGSTTVIAEGGQFDSYQVVLNSEPSDGNVALLITPDAACNVDLASLIFNRSNWADPVTIRVSSPANDIDDGDRSCTINHAITASDAVEYPTAMAIADVAAAVIDDDTAGVLVSESWGGTAVGEDGTLDTYKMVLTSQPSAGEVQIQLSKDGECLLSAESHSFNAANWNLPLTVTVSTSDNFVDDGNRSCALSHSIAHSDASEYPVDMPVDGLVVAVIDDDAAGVVINESGGDTTVGEDGTTDTYDIVLNSQPSSGYVVVWVNPGPLCHVVPNAHGFDATNWDDPVTITVASAEPDNDVSEGNRSCSIAHEVVASESAEYPTAILVDGVTVTILDDEDPTIFTDGFETGNLSEWSLVHPVG